MPNKARIAALRKQTRADPQAEDIRKIEEELFSIGSDRATAVMFGSFAEQSLRRLLVAAMRPNISSDEKDRIFGDRGIAGSFSSKITAAWAFNVIGPIIYSDLNIIREIRNAAAHSRMSFSFYSKEVEEVCKCLSIVDQGGTYIPFNYLERLSQDERSKAEDLANPKTRFVTSCHFISYRMHQKVNGPVAGDIAFEELLP